MKLNKITIIEIIVLLIVFVAVAIYFSPYFTTKQQDRLKAKIKSQNSVFVSCTLEEFSKNFSLKSSQAAQIVVDKLNKTEKNPYDRKKDAYTFDTQCQGCNSVEYDDSLSMVILTTYDKKGELVARTVIKPPSFVTYYKDDENGEETETKIEITE